MAARYDGRRQATIGQPLPRLENRRFVTEGPFMSSSLPIAGFFIIEAADMAETINEVSGVPCAAPIASRKCGLWRQRPDR
ncbi:hypothetical protein BSFA1_75360 (plasmid) [Burkholderia sp. SFA1]|nr:hypothetical protein BSFA1_75360 [Burkholderia sp. SFA1]